MFLPLTIVIFLITLLFASPARAAETLRRIETKDDRVVYVSPTKWHLKTRWYECVSIDNNSFAVMNSGCTKYFELKSAASIPTFLVVPSSYMPEVVGGVFQKQRQTKFNGFNTTIYSRKVKVRLIRSKALLVKAQDSISLTASSRAVNMKGGVLETSGVEEIWVTRDIPAPPNLLKFLILYYNCNAVPLNMMPVKHVLNFPGEPVELDHHYFEFKKVSSAPSWATFGQLPKNCVKTKDVMEVMTGSDGGVLDFLYQGAKR